jgi:hypothetical protein
MANHKNGPVGKQSKMNNRGSSRIRKVKLYFVSGLLIAIFCSLGLFGHVSANTGPSNFGKIAAAPAGQITSRTSPFGAISAEIVNPATTFHWYAGGVYAGKATQDRVVSTTITVPKGTPNSKQYYYEILSAWDNSNPPSYDQIGFTNDHGVWGLVYSYTTGPCDSLSYHFNPDARTLTAGKTYTFNMSISTGAGGGVFFAAYQGKTLVYSKLNNDGATKLSISATSTSCKDYGYTVYEEAYMPTSTSVPNFNFQFNANTYGAGSGSKPIAADLKAFYITAPSAVKVTISGTTHSVCKITN